MECASESASARGARQAHPPQAEAAPSRAMVAAAGCLGPSKLASLRQSASSEVPSAAAADGEIASASSSLTSVLEIWPSRKGSVSTSTSSRARCTPCSVIR
eukprot:6199883-Pleurochrysis_carterae.AAC.5